jgi:tetratricopeptide (TPR) repeat protein
MCCISAILHAAVILVAALRANLGHAQLPLQAVHTLPPQTPAWLEDYAVRWPVRVLGFVGEQSAKSVVVSIPGSGRLKADASDLAVQAADGTVLPAAVLSHHPLGDTVIQFPRKGSGAWYWVYGIGAKAGPRTDAKAAPELREGLTLEVRDGKGLPLDSWANVRAGLEKSEVIGNAIVTQILQNCNPARPDVTTNFGVSYRGWLDVRTEGTHRFLVSGEDACFLFVDGFKVYERAGSGGVLPPKIKVSELDKLAGKVELKPGPHFFELHQAIGDRPQVLGRCVMMVSPAGQTKFTVLHADDVVQPLYGRVAATETRPGQSAVDFAFGIDDTLDVQGLKVFLVRFQAHGNVPDEQIVWDMGDGTTRKGRSILHCYFTEDDYVVTVSGGTLPGCKRRIRVWPEPGEMSPFSLEHAVEALGQMDWRKLERGRVREMFTFLQACEQPTRWALLNEVAQFLEEQQDVDLESRSQYVAARMESLTQLGKANEALKLGEASKALFAKSPPLLVRLQLATAAIHQYHFKDAAAASKIYKAILDENSRVEHPNLRIAGVRWGDLFAEAGDLTRADETYRIAATLGGEKLTSGAVTDAATRGALMRIAEQKLKGGEITATRQLLQRLEMEYPGRRLDGLYCFLRAETDRFSGRYEEAMRNYDMIFKLPQWAGYRDRATYGIADAYLRMGELDKAKKWFGQLKDEFPKFFEMNKGKEIEELIASRLARQEAGMENLTERIDIGFEPTEPIWFSSLVGLASVRTLGVQGEHALLIDPYPVEKIKLYDLNRPVKNLVPGGTYWAEVWTQDIVRMPSPVATNPQYGFHLIKLGEAGDGVNHPVQVPRTSHHQWHKMSMKVKAPLAQDFTMRIRCNQMVGAFLLDRITVRHVGDRRLDAQVQFLESSKAP